MDIDSKKWRLRSDGVGGIQIECKAAMTLRTVPADDLPSAESLAAMHEREFNRVCMEAFQKA
ncbi:hypothetical protein [Hoeflea sp.]|uniref:hypothetical protein n=1 Tax=Hoeflea sp. TaxID=1940281 RepID=UPI003B52A6B1